MATYISYTSNINVTYSGVSSYVSMIGAPLPPTGTTNIYLFGVDNTSSLQLESTFTGNFKGWIAGTSNTGINPDLLGLVDGTWQDTTDLDNPVWNVFDGLVTNLAYVVNDAFTGIVYAVQFDGVLHYIDMGAPIYPELFELDYGSIPDGVEVTEITGGYRIEVVDDTVAVGYSRVNIANLEKDSDYKISITVSASPRAFVTIAPTSNSADRLSVIDGTISFNEVINSGTNTTSQAIFDSSALSNGDFIELTNASIKQVAI